MVEKKPMEQSDDEYSSSSSESSEEDLIEHKEGAPKDHGDDDDDDDDEDGVEDLDHTAAGQQKSSSSEMIEAEFEFFDPKTDDFHGVKSLLNNYMDNIIDISTLSDLVVEQTVLGTVVKTDGSCMAVVSCIPLSDAVRSCLSQVHESVREAVAGPRVGLLVYSRLINLPLELVPDMFTSLVKDIDWAMQHGGPQYDFETIVCIARIEQQKVGKKRSRSGQQFQYEEFDVIEKVYQVLKCLTAC